MLPDESAVKYAYPDQLEELGQALLEMHTSGVLGGDSEEFLANLEQFRSKLASVENFEQLKTAMAGDVADLYQGDHLEFVCQVMPLIPDQDGYSYDAKQRWYLDGVLVPDESDSAASDAAAGRKLDEEKGLYFDEENWYDENGARLEWDADRYLYAAGDRWYDSNFVPLGWSEANSLYYDSGNNWYDENGFPLQWVQEGDSPGHYLARSGARYDENASLIPDTAPVDEQETVGTEQPIEAVRTTDVADVVVAVDVSATEAAEMTAEKTVTEMVGSGEIPDDLGDDLPSAFREMLAEHPEAAALTKDEIRQLFAELASEPELAQA